ncbi:hypothetical protein DBW_1991 [Desulfuromonas sp. DDH964]|uniref:hypothetical protein n=1 Tax=Desulfuromonas sp. DDH964 TaxID=1823759 RepID=UPI00078B9F9C|nr:hypothetical protein [Desulfuromonas sp. DDH964]AMV72340.1 hypothetical protein DBW_1991 [Desulfuromonas sp. DDH964]
MPRLLTIFCLLWLLMPVPAPAGSEADTGSVVTLWPLLDWRSSPSTDYAALHILGPIFKWETKGEEREVALRPLFYHAASSQQFSTDLIFPLVRSQGGEGTFSFSLLNLLNEDQINTGSPQREHSFTLFPLLFYKNSPGQETSFALFPLGGRIVNRFNRDVIRFALFPLYGQTRKGTTTVTNILWPFFALVDGENEAGFKAWPLFGVSRKAESYRKQFYLWPLIFHYDLDLETDHPRRIRTFWPFYGSDQSSRQRSRVFLWPFFSFREDHEKGYKKWDFPWPILGVTRGQSDYGNRFFPLFAYDRHGEKEKLWLPWPIYRYDRVDSPVLQRRQHRVLFFLYRDFQESDPGEVGIRLRRVTFWPLFRYQRDHGVSHFSLLALMEPFFPNSDGIERNWAPLWRVYQCKWDPHGNRVDTLLWNLIWQERRPESVAMEVFPFFAFRSAAGNETDISLLKGLIRYRRDHAAKKVTFFFLPWGISWGQAPSADAGRG